MPRPGGPRVQEKSKDFFGSIKRLIGNLKPWKVFIIGSLVLAMISSILALVAPNRLSDFTDEITAGLVPRTEKIEVISREIFNNLSSEVLNGKIENILNSKDVSKENKQLLMTTLEENSMNQEQTLSALLNLPDEVLIYLFEDIEVDGVNISVNDQIKTIRLLNKMDNSKEAYELIDELPESVYSLIKPIMNLKRIKTLAIFIGSIYCFSALFSFIQSLSMTTVSNRFAMKLRTSVSSKINKLPLKYFDSHETGDILSRITNDIDTIGQNLNNSLSTLVSSITLLIGSVLMMFITNWIMALTAIITSLIGFAFMGSILGKSQKYFADSQKALGELNGYIEEMYSGHNIVKAYNATEKTIIEFEKLNQDLYEAKKKSIFLSGTMQPLMGFIGNLGFVAVCIVGALLSMNNYITFGVIVAFIIYVRLFSSPLSQIAQAMTNLQSTAAASERVFEFLDEKEMNDESNLKEKLAKNKVQGNIEFKNVKFGYDENKIIINGFSAQAKSGQKIAIVGPTGAGKTTMVNLLMKFYEINDGDILIDGVSVSKLTRENIHELFIMVLQDTWLFDGTIRDNIKFNKENVTDEQIWDALKNVGVDHFVKTLPGGLDCKLSDNDSISQGQKQLLTIARGMIEDAPFLILDEATSNVDTRTEELVASAMDKLMVGKTSFIIAHRLSTIKNADLILVMNEGNIIESGNHKSLIEKNGFYAELYNSQFQK